MTVPDSSTPQVIARPPLLYLGFLLAGLGADGLWPVAAIAGPLPITVGLVLVTAGVILGFLAARRFRNAGTSIPTRRASTALVTDGPYALSRNPIYVAMTAIYVGIGVAAGGLWTLLLVAPLLVLIRYGVIGREERYLEDRFGDDYGRYRDAVRRWV